jgi:hypothetical protein
MLPLFASVLPTQKWRMLTPINSFVTINGPFILRVSGMIDYVGRLQRLSIQWFEWPTLAINV